MGPLKILEIDQNQGINIVNTKQWKDWHCRYPPSTQNTL